MNVRFVLHTIGWLSTIASMSLALSAHGDELSTILKLAGWDENKFATFEHRGVLTDEELVPLAPLAGRLHSFDAFSIDRWTVAEGIPSAARLPSVQAYGRLFRVVGRVHRVVRLPSTGKECFRCDFKLAPHGRRAVVVAAAVPSAWLDSPAELDERASASALIVKNGVVEDEHEPLLLVAPRIAWHPQRADGLNESYGRAILGGLGFDVGLFDEVVNRRPIRAEEREAFYQLMDATDRITPAQLSRSALDNLPHIARRWQQRQSPDRQQRLMSQDVVQQAAAGRYSVAPLFNDADNQLGSLVVLEGTARRSVRIDVGHKSDGQLSDVARRFGITHYWELDLFTADSQNYPVVVCTRQLPEGFPEGPKIHEPVRVAGFFFKSWRHRTRQPTATDAHDTRQQLAPLLISPGVEWIELDSTTSNVPATVGATLFVLVLVVVWIAVWRSHRRDRASRRLRKAQPLEMPAGQSLDDLLDRTSEA